MKAFKRIQKRNIKEAGKKPRKLEKKMPAIFNVPENEIHFESFTSFSLFLFRLTFFKFKPLHADSSIRDKFWHHARILYTMLAVFELYSAMISKFVLLLNSKTLDEAGPFLLDVFTYFLNSTRVYHSVLRREDIWELLQDMKTLFDSRLEDTNRCGLKKHLDNFHRLMILYSIPYLLLIFLHLITIFPYLLFGSMNLASEYYFPFDPYRYEIFPFVYLYTVYNVLTALINIVAIDSSLYAVITTLSIEFDTLKDDLKNILKETANNRKKKMQDLIDRHNKLMDISDNLQEIYTVTFLLNFVISSLILCFAVFQISKLESFSTYMFFFVYFIMMSGSILLLCTYGQRIIDSSEAVADGIYESGWEDFNDNEFKKQIIMISLRAQKPKQLTAMNFASVSLESFAAVNILKECKFFSDTSRCLFFQILTSTGSYFSLLRSVYTEG